ncbi:TRZ/ATZ family hydrolase [Pseudohongiella acticola]|jgi:5-methylthioadenosine/S-adenosylhomocysteine deaminase|uniref:TRZ/ATZ family hydrolase n=1 Tax=Pseudohongiella acticola TaxID=1524254 RepID=UPI0030EB8320
MSPSENQPDVDLVIHARWIIPATDDQAILENHSIAVRNGSIVGLHPTPDIARHYSSARRELTLDQHALIPGLINAHGHAGMTLMRGIADDLPLQTWLNDHIWPLEGKWISEEFVYQGTQLAIAEMIRGGTTCYADMYFFPEASARAASEAGIRVQLAAPVIDFPTPWAADADECISKTTELHDAWRNSELVSTAFGPHAPYTVSDESLRKVLTFAEELDLPIHMHVHETAFEVEDALKNTGQRPIRRLHDLGLLGPRLLCVHATQLDDDDLALLQQTSTHVVHCPESNLKLASGFCPVHQLQTTGINVALGTDGAASNNDLDMFSEMRTAALLAKACAGDASALPAYGALQMATINGARAMGLEHLTGTLESGKRADMTAVRLDSLNAMPVYNPVSQLVYSTQASQVSHVWVNGKALLDDGELTTINRRQIQELAHTWQQRLQHSTNDGENA